LYAQVALRALHARCTPLSAAWKYPIVPSLGICAIFNLVAAEAGATEPVTSVVVTSAAVAIAASSFFKVFPFVENKVKLFLISPPCLGQ
jgi:hypothetical protein